MTPLLAAHTVLEYMDRSYGLTTTPGVLRGTSGIQAHYPVVNLNKFLFEAITDTRPALRMAWEESHDALVEGAFKIDNTAKMDLAFHNDPSSKAGRHFLYVYQVAYGHDMYLSHYNAFLRQISEFHNQAPNPFVRIRNIMVWLIAGKGIFDEEWNRALKEPLDISLSHS